MVSQFLLTIFRKFFNFDITSSIDSVKDGVTIPPVIRKDIELKYHLRFQLHHGPSQPFTRIMKMTKNDDKTYKYPYVFNIKLFFLNN